MLEHGHKELADCVHSAADKLIGQLTETAGIRRDEIYLLCFVGNTCMHHIFFQYPMESLVRAPYEPSQKGLIRKKASEFDIHIHPEGELIFLPVIAGFVGADTMGCILSLRPDLQEEISLMLDIGTNGELVLGNKDRLVCCSTAAGPAFEGAKIHCGMRGAQGAIDHMSYDSSGFHYTVIGQEAPKGICGSGLIDTIACLRRSGLIDEGRLLNKEEAAGLQPAFDIPVESVPASSTTLLIRKYFSHRKMSGKYSLQRALLLQESFSWRNTWASPMKISGRCILQEPSAIIWIQKAPVTSAFFLIPSETG